VAGAYGLLYGRLNLEITHQRIRLARLPKAFEGFRIVQLSDFHISAFMSAEEIRSYAAIANRLRPDLVALTGDFITWDAAAQGAVVEALSGLKAPFGVFGCLGNHEWMAETEDSITRLFAAQGTRILRGERVAIESAGSTLNLLGVDYQIKSAAKDAHESGKSSKPEGGYDKKTEAKDISRCRHHSRMLWPMLGVGSCGHGTVREAGLRLSLPRPRALSRRLV
jgi:predicted MPP superfamily phosphohydrolase